MASSYCHDPSDWIDLTNGVAAPFTHAAATNWPSVYYRIVSGTYTSAYDIGKFTVPIPGGPAVRYLGSPFLFQSPMTVSNLCGRQLQGGTLAQRDTVFTEDGPTKYADPDWTGTAWASVLSNATGLLVQRSAAHSNATSLVYLGIVATNAELVTGIRRAQGDVNYLSTLCATTQSVYQCGLTNGVLVPGGTLATWDTLLFESGPIKYRNDGTFTSDKILQPGEAFGLQYRTSRSPALTNWYRPKP